MSDSEGAVEVLELGWSEMTERSWSQLVAKGLPRQLMASAEELGNRSGRAVRIYTMPTLRAGCSGLALPFLDDDGITVDPALLSDPGALAEAVAYLLAYLLDPRWNDDAASDNQGDRKAFAAALGPILLEQSSEQTPTTNRPMVDSAWATIYPEPEPGS